MVNQDLQATAAALGWENEQNVEQHDEQRVEQRFATKELVLKPRDWKALTKALNKSWRDHSVQTQTTYGALLSKI